MNAHRGEVMLVLGADKIILRPTFAALAAIEQQTNKSLIVLVRGLADGDFRLGELVSIIKATAVSPTDLPPEIADAIVATGIMAVLETCLVLLVQALRGAPTLGGADA